MRWKRRRGSAQRKWKGRAKEIYIQSILRFLACCTRLSGHKDECWLGEVSWIRMSAKTQVYFLELECRCWLSHSESSQKRPPPLQAAAAATEAAASATTSLTLRGMRNCDNFPTQINLHFHYTLPRDYTTACGPSSIQPPNTAATGGWWGWNAGLLKLGSVPWIQIRSFQSTSNKRAYIIRYLSVFLPSLATLLLLLSHFSLFFIRKSAIHSQPLPGIIHCMSLSVF